MNEALSACENICNDFNWVGPLTEWLRNIAIIFGVIVAWRQLDSWRQEKVAVRRGELAEEIMATAFEIASKISGLRSPWGYGAPEGEADDGTYDYKRRRRELAEMDDDFRTLRRLSVRQKAFLGCNDLEEAISKLFKVRGKLFANLNSKIRTIELESRNSQPPTKQMLERIERQDAVIWEGGDAEGNDAIKNLVDEALSVIERRSIPLVRMEQRK